MITEKIYPQEKPAALSVTGPVMERQRTEPTANPEPIRIVACIFLKCHGRGSRGCVVY